MAIKLALLVVFFGIMLAVGVHCRRHATDVTASCSAAARWARG